MILWIYLAFLLISFILIGFSLFRPEHTELGIAGFTFLFILSFVMITGDIQYKVGINETITHSCLCCEQDGSTYLCDGSSENFSIQPTQIERVDVYATWVAGGTLSHTVGYLLAVISVVGLIGTFVSLKPEGFMK